MADYGFYVNAYLGSSIPEKHFPKLAAQAASVLESYEHSYRVRCPGPDSRKFAICAMAESLYEEEKRARGLHAATNGACTETPSLEQQLYRKARIYLDIYRGVS